MAYGPCEVPMCGYRGAGGWTSGRSDAHVTSVATRWLLGVRMYGRDIFVGSCGVVNAVKVTM
eukprot:7333281-Karenia_brevis.AAC.1